MRIISGRFKGRRLTAPAGMDTRPTADRIKESIFNILGHSIRNTKVLDLFAGTGALGIEALSRGAESAVFVDQADKAVSAIRHNVRRLEVEDRINIIRWNIRKNLNCLTSIKRNFDLVFMDPPYERDFVSPTLANLISCGALYPNGRIVIEHGIREPVDVAFEMLSLVDQRSFGKTLVSFMVSMI